MATHPVLLRFRLDLRLEDNPALRAAVANKSPVIPIFIWAPEEEDPWQPGAASRWWLHQSLNNLEKELFKIGSRLIVRKGPTEDAIHDLLREMRADSVYWNRRYEPATRERDSKLKLKLQAQGTQVQSFNSALLFEPWTVLNQSGQPFQVFSAFWKTCLKQPSPLEPERAPTHLDGPPHWPASSPLRELGPEPKIDWAVGIRAVWTPGEAGARRDFKRFLRGNFEQYASERNAPSKTGTSRQSPHLHFGEISPRELWHALLARRNSENAEISRFLHMGSRLAGIRLSSPLPFPIHL